MKKHIVDLLERTRARNAGTLIGAYGSENPTEREVLLQMIEGLLCNSEVWKRPQSMLSHQAAALSLLAAEIQSGERIGLCGELGNLMRARGLLPENGFMVGWRMLDEKEIPIAGDEACFEGSDKWEAVTIPSMWLAGGRRTPGVQFRRRIAQS